jgi:hypothetical protein
MKNIFSNNNSKASEKFKSLLSNRGILYLLFALAIGNLFYLGTSNDIWTIAIFVLTGFLTSFFSKNMVVILCIALAVSSIIKYGTPTSSSEGFDIADADKDKIRSAVEGLLGGSSSSKENKTSKESESEGDESFETPSSDKTDGNTSTKGNSVSGNAKVSGSME